jgi:hypothetical protein
MQAQTPGFHKLYPGTCPNAPNKDTGNGEGKRKEISLAHRKQRRGGTSAHLSQQTFTLGLNRG